jgi:hypothetical protein
VEAIIRGNRVEAIGGGHQWRHSEAISEIALVNVNSERASMRARRIELHQWQSVEAIIRGNRVEAIGGGHQ